MKTFVVLLRGVNVGGKNAVPMAKLKQHLEASGFDSVKTYIASGNVLLRSDLLAADVQSKIERLLSKNFELDSELIKVLALSHDRLRSVVRNKPEGFGDKPGVYHSDAIFLIGLDAKDVMPVFNPREGVDRVWPGESVIYSERLSAQRTKSRLSRIAAVPAYKSMTIRSWATTVKLLELADDLV